MKPHGIIGRTWGQPLKSCSAFDVRKLRQTLGLSQSAFARLIPTTPRTIRHWEKDGRTPNPVYLARLRAIQRETQTIPVMRRRRLGVRPGLLPSDYLLLP